MDDQLIEAVTSHVEIHLGAVSVLHELILEEPHIDILIAEPQPKRQFYTLVTCGMSEVPMGVPLEVAGQVADHIELMLCLPSDWQLDNLDDERWEWPVFWLRFLAKQTHELNTFLAAGHTIPNGEDCDPFGSNTKMCCWFVRTPAAVGEDFLQMRDNDRTIAFLAIVPIYRSEMDFALSGDDKPEELDNLLTAAGVTELIDPQRKPVR